LTPPGAPGILQKAMDEQSPAPPPRRSSTGLAIVAGLAVLGSLVGALLYQASQNQKSPEIDTTGFDVSQVSAPSAPRAAAAAPASPVQSSLAMISGVLPGMNFGRKQADNPSAASAASGPSGPKTQAQAAQDFTGLCRSNEGLVRSMAEDYTRRYPAIRQYGKDWMSYPDLKKLNDDYMRDHDPVAFLRGVAKSDNFGKLVVKYAGDPSIQAFVKDAMTHAPSQVTSAALSYVKKDDLVGQLMDKVTGALGMPAGLFGGMSSGAGPPKIDANQVMGQMMNSNPDVQKALANPEVQKQMQDSSVQGQLNGLNQQR
jgi:hypothetical protein